MYKEDLVLNGLQWLICHKAKPTEIMFNIHMYIYEEDLVLNAL